MNRALRRAAARAKPIEPQRRELPRHLDEFTIFSDIERVLEKIGHGEIEHASGRAVMMASDGQWYEVVPALNGWISAWKAFDTRFQLGHDLGALVRLSNCLNYATPISPQLLAAARSIVKEQRRLFRRIDRDKLASAARTEQIRLLMPGAA